MEMEVWKVWTQTPSSHNKIDNHHTATSSRNTEHTQHLKDSKDGSSKET